MQERDPSTHRVLVFDETLIIPAQADQEQDTSDILEAVYPFPPFALLASYVDHKHVMVCQLEARFSDADCPCPASDDVLFCGLI